MIHKQNWEETKRHFEAFWNRDYERRCNLILCTPNHTPYPLLSEETASDEAWYTSPDILYARWVNEARRWNYHGEAFPYGFLYFGTGGHAAYFGAKPRYAEKRDTIWFDEFLHEPDASLLHFDPQSPALRRQLDIANTMARRAGEDFLVGMNDNCGCIDALAELRGPQNLLFDMMDDPEFVCAARDKIVDAWKVAQQQFFEVLAENNFGGSSQSWMQLWSDKRQAQIQCDFSVMISPEMFEQFVLPEIEESAAFLDYTTYHLDGMEQIRHLDMLLSVKRLDNIQWTPVAGQPKTSHFIGELQRIQAAGKGLILIPQLDEVEFLMTNLSHKGLHLIVNGVRDDEQAEDLLRLAERLAH